MKNLRLILILWRGKAEWKEVGQGNLTLPSFYTMARGAIECRTLFPKQV
jgi:hypothetical protein